MFNENLCAHLTIHCFKMNNSNICLSFILSINNYVLWKKVEKRTKYFKFQNMNLLYNKSATLLVNISNNVTQEKIMAI
jgi:hypothetical protein